MMGYEGNRRSGVALAMRHRLSGLSTYGLKGQCAGGEHPAYASGHGPFTSRSSSSISSIGGGGGSKGMVFSHVGCCSVYVQ